MGPPKLTEAETRAAYGCVAPFMTVAYGKSGVAVAEGYRGWARFSRISYPAEAHGNRFMNNYANATARGTYAKWEGLGTMPAGSVVAKDSFILDQGGRISVGPLFIMEKRGAGFNTAMGDWRYQMVMPDGALRGDADIQTFCNNCHRRAGKGNDNLMFAPLSYRTSAK